MDQTSTETGPVAGPGPGTDSANRRMSSSPHAKPPRRAWGVLTLFFVMHVLDSVDHWLLAAVMRSISDELNLSAILGGWLSTVLLLGMAAACLPVGYLADRLRRPRLLAVGFAISSVASVATGLANRMIRFRSLRAIVGVGSATFEVVALTMLMDVFPRRFRCAGTHNILPGRTGGAALGWIVGGAFAHVTTWHTAFLAVGAPGLVLALTALVLSDPVRGESEGVDIECGAVARTGRAEPRGLHRHDGQFFIYVLRIWHHVFLVALAGLVYWSPTFLMIVKGLTQARAERCWD